MKLRCVWNNIPFWFLAFTSKLDEAFLIPGVNLISRRGYFFILWFVFGTGFHSFQYLGTLWSKCLWVIRSNLYCLILLFKHFGRNSLRLLYRLYVLLHSLSNCYWTIIHSRLFEKLKHHLHHCTLLLLTLTLRTRLLRKSRCLFRFLTEHIRAMDYFNFLLLMCLSMQNRLDLRSMSRL